MKFCPLIILLLLTPLISQAAERLSCQELADDGIRINGYKLSDTSIHGIPLSSWDSKLLDRIDKRFEECGALMPDSNGIRVKRKYFNEDRQKIITKVTEMLWAQHIKANVEGPIKFCNSFLQQALVEEALSSRPYNKIELITISESDYTFLEDINSKVQSLVAIANNEFHGIPDGGRYYEFNPSKCSELLKLARFAPPLPLIEKSEFKGYQDQAEYTFDSGFSFNGLSGLKRTRQKAARVLDDLYMLRAKHGWKYDDNELASEIEHYEDLVSEIYELEKEAIDECKSLTMADIARYKNWYGFAPCRYE